ncbi:MAG: hypothetical protein EBS34_09855 [Flavobacteriales bacterium]|nr:hypothetical protein [Flavobacteriales bacterium]
MAKYKTELIYSGDTIQNIAKKYLGDEQKWPVIASLNRLRNPYISDNPEDQLGNSSGAIYLSEEMNQGSTYIALPKYLYSSQQDSSAGRISKSVLSSNNKIFMKRYTQNGDYIHDTITIRNVYFEKNTNYPNIPDGYFYIEFESAIVVPPLTSAINAKLFSYVSATSSSDKYYITYSYVANDGNETIPAPFNEKLYGQSYAKEYFVPASNSTIVFSAPSVWPEGAKSVNVYMAKIDYSLSDFANSSLYLQGNISEPSGTLSITLLNTSLPVTGSKNPQLHESSLYSGKPKKGTSNYYPSGTKMFFYSAIYDDTYVLRTGDKIQIPIYESNSTKILNAYSSSQIDSYGKDIKIDSSGQITFLGNSSTDLTTISGRENVIQALNNKIKTKYGKLKAFPSYGNSAIQYIGSKYSPSIVKATKDSIYSTIMSDERVSGIVSMDVRYDAISTAIIAENIYVRLSENFTVVNLNPVSIGI